jgi:hypothetical protein
MPYHRASMATPLGSVLEHDDLTAGPRGRLTVDVLEAWLEAGTVLEIVVPVRLACARCEGGGCDACGKSGAIRINGGEQERSLQVTLSESARGLRLMRPLGADAGLDQLIVELRPAAVPSDFCRRVHGKGQKTFLIPLIVILALVSALIAALVLHR